MEDKINSFATSCLRVMLGVNGSSPKYRDPRQDWNKTNDSASYNPSTEISGPYPATPRRGTRQVLCSIHHTPWKEETRPTTHVVSEIHSAATGGQRWHSSAWSDCGHGTRPWTMEKDRGRLRCSRPMMMMSTCYIGVVQTNNNSVWFFGFLHWPPAFRRNSYTSFVFAVKNLDIMDVTI